MPKAALNQVSDVENLRRAWNAIKKRNQRSRGLDDVTIYQFRAGLEQNLRRISTELRTSSYVFNKLRPHAIDKLGSTKKRPIQIAAVRDRVVMKAIANFISPTFAKFNLTCSFAYVKDGGVDAAIKRIRELIDQGYGIYLEADIINFFGRVNKELLWNRFSGHIRHKSLLPLIRQCFDLELGDIENLKTEDQKLFLGADSGIPQGGCLSPMLANFYLYDFDRKMLHSGFHLVRYADDFVIMCESQERAEQAYSLCNRALRDLKLEIHPLGSEKTRIAKFSKEGLGFLGLHLQGKQAIPAKKSRERFELKIRETLKPYNGVSLFATLQKLRNTIHGWENITGA
jgi:RNA-directed DNA polymerase